MASDQDLSRWRIDHNISDDAFNSLQTILARSGQTETVPDITNNMVFQDDSWLTNAIDLNGSLPIQGFFEADPFTHPFVVDPFVASSHAELYSIGPSANDAHMNDSFLSGNYNRLTNGNIENPRATGSLYQVNNHSISSIVFSQTGLSIVGDPNVDKSPYYENTPTIYESRDPQTSVIEGQAMTEVQSKRNHRFTPYSLTTRGDYKKKRTPPCIKCWLRRRQCNGDIGGLCNRCQVASLPLQVCIRIRFADNAVFSKWQDAHYRVKLEWENLHWIASPRSVLLTHQKGGPRFPIDCREFVAASPDQIRIHWKDKERWPWMETTAFGLEKRDVNLDVYISEFSDFYLVEARRDGSYIGEILNLVKSHSKGPLVELALKLWAANRLLMEGWQLEGEDLLEMPVVKQSDCPLYNKVPVPRVLENQLDRHLESHIVNIEGRLLKMLQNALLQKSNSDPIDIFLSVTMILHVVERDIWRLLWWWYHEEQDYKWRHPSTPVYLIERNIQFTKLLLAHIRCARLIPDDFVLQLGRFRTQLQGGEKAHARYNEIKEDSLDSTLSSLAIVKDIKVVAELDDFVYRTSEVTGTIVA